MAEVFQLQPREQWQFSVDVVKRADGSLAAVIIDARGSIIEANGTSAGFITTIAKMLEQSVEGMRATAQAVKS